MKTVLSIFFTVAFFSTNCIAQELEWAKSFGGISHDQGHTVTVDYRGNVITTGFFTGSIDANPNAGIETLTSDKSGLYVQKLDSRGNFIWAMSFENANGQSSHIITDNYGNIYIYGVYNGTTDFNPDASVESKTSLNNYEMFVLKLNSQGDFQWVSTIENEGAHCSFTSMNITDSESLVLTGSSTGNTDFDPSVREYILDCNTEKNNFILSLDRDGQFDWVVQTELYITSSCINNSDNILLTGGVQGTVDLDFGAGEAIYTSVDEFADIFILELNRTGEYIQHKILKGSGADFGHKIEVDGNNNIYLLCNPSQNLTYFQNDLSFEESEYGSILVKTDGNGLYKWHRKITGVVSSEVQMSVNEHGNILFKAYFFSSAIADDGIFRDTVYSNGLYDNLLVKFNTHGHIQWLRRMGCSTSGLNDMILLDSEIMYITGTFHSTCDFDVSDSLYNLTSNGSYDAFVQRFETCESYYRLLGKICHGDSISYNGRIISEPSVVRDTFLGYHGCDSIVVFTAEAAIAKEEEQSMVVCDQFTWINGETYFSDTLVSHTLKTFDGCDSTIYLDLVVEDCTFRVFVPNSFTPNNDGLNDYFKPLGNRIESYELFIYTRWGELIYRSSDPDGWDGADAQPGLYMYDILLIGEDGKETLRRRESGVVHLLK